MPPTLLEQQPSLSLSLSASTLSFHPNKSFLSTLSFLLWPITTTMFHSTMELITQASSNSLFVFCFCNLIIVILLFSSSKPPSDFDDHEDNNATPLPVLVAIRNKTNKKGVNLENSCGDNKALMDFNLVSNTQIALINDKRNRNDDDDDNNDDDKKALMDFNEVSNTQIALINDNDDDNNNHDDDELRRRVEEFIDKVNKEWRAEKMRTSALVHIENLQLGIGRSRAI